MQHARRREADESVQRVSGEAGCGRVEVSRVEAQRMRTPLRTQGGRGRGRAWRGGALSGCTRTRRASCLRRPCPAGASGGAVAAQSALISPERALQKQPVPQGAVVGVAEGLVGGEAQERAQRRVGPARIRY